NPTPLTTLSGSATSYDDTTATQGTPYWYQVAAGSARTERRSNEQSPPLLAATAPATPLLTATAGNGHVQLTWPLPGNGGSALTGFTVARGTTSGGEITLTTLGASATSFDDTNATNGTTYFYTVTAH